LAAFLVACRVSGSAPVVEIHADTSGMGGPGWYSPATIPVPPGTTVTWVNRDLRPHSVRSVAGLFDSDLIKPGETWSYRFDQPGEFVYECYRCFCNPMVGRVVVASR
jgi:plastocyanin